VESKTGKDIPTQMIGCVNPSTLCRKYSRLMAHPHVAEWES
jgi:hypothetical protein